MLVQRKKSPCWKAVTSKPPPSVACINQTKVVPPSQGLPSSNIPPPPQQPQKEGSLKVGLLFQPYYSLYRDHISTLKKKKLPSLSESSATSLFLFVACMTVSWNGFTQTGSKATMISSTFVTTTRKIVSQWLLQVCWVGNLNFHMFNRSKFSSG